MVYAIICFYSTADEKCLSGQNWWQITNGCLYVLLYHNSVPNARQLYIFVVGISKNLLEKIVFFIVFATKCAIMLIKGINCKKQGGWSFHPAHAFQGIRISPTEFRLLCGGYTLLAEYLFYRSR